MSNIISALECSRALRLLKERNSTAAYNFLTSRDDNLARDTSRAASKGSLEHGGITASANNGCFARRRCSRESANLAQNEG